MIARPVAAMPSRHALSSPTGCGRGGRRAGGRNRRLASLLASVAAVALASCTMTPDPIGPADVKTVVQADLAQLFTQQEPISGPLTIHEAMARVLKYNLDNRLKLMEEALSARQVDVATVSMLPRMAATAGYVSRSNVNASSSESITTGSQSLETSTSQEQDRGVADLSVTWNILDFGVSYVAAKQQSDRALIASERRRKVVQNILQDTRLVFWRAVAADRLAGRVGTLLHRIDGALRDSRTIAQQRLDAPLEALAYQRALLRTRQQLLDLQRELRVSKTQLATLMDLPPATQVALAVPAREDRSAPQVALQPEEIERTALVRRPELVEEVYQARIGSDETLKAMLRMLPGLEVNTSLNFDSNDYLLYNEWAEYGTRVVWNLFNLFTGPANVALAEAQEEFIKSRRMALAMAVLTQSRVSWLRYRQSLEDFEVARQIETVERAILGQIRDQVAAEQRGELDAIQAEFDSLLADLKADLAYAETQNAAGNILVTMGFDPLPESLPDNSVATIAKALAAREAEWFAGKVPALPDPTAQAPAPVQSPVQAAAPPVAAPATVAANAVASPATAPSVTPPSVTPPSATPPSATAPSSQSAAVAAAFGGAPLVLAADPTPATAPASVAAAAAATVPTPPAAVAAVHLGTYATESLARQSWELLRQQHAAQLPSREPVLVSQTRRSDGKPFVLLRADGFADATAAERFCEAIRDQSRTCAVSEPAATSG